MKSHYNHYFLIKTIVLCLITLLYSCSENDPSSKQLNQSGQLVNSTTKSNYSTSELKLISTIGGFENLSDLIEFDIESYSIEYTTRDINGNIINASGVISIPKTDQSLSSILLSRGTILAHSNAPSVNILPTYELGAALGYIIMTPDLIGFNTTSLSPQNYFIKEITATSSIDFMLACIQFLNQKQVDFNDDLILAGYSQGGHSTFSIAESFEQKNTSEFTISKLYAGAGGYFLNNVMSEIIDQDTYDAPSFLSLIVYSYNENYSLELPYSYYFNSPYDNRITSILDGSNTISQANSQLTNEVDQLFTSTFLNSIKKKENTINNFLADNSIQPIKFEYPIELYHSINDEILPISTSDSLYTVLNELGNTVNYTKVTGSHSDAAIDILIRIFDDLKQ
ncbi:lipase family protein [Flammeovirga pacifica]|uniref:Uncharacterized protein n=1 Tax=Flammeovirga pacifica TaxID=915059 RepID=A0A1S1YWY2_FLAPC|nr:lipase family protein [Flammeovirga pacifica]OHX65514.1 hypothetical protein NH26_03710 [Flammeovirga pacifica]